MKPLKIKYAKAVCLSVFYICIVIAVFIGITKLAGLDVSIDGIALMVGMSAVLLHFMDKENKEDEEE